jgi:general secretion pathway protein J
MKNKGFTLLELLVALAIFAVLSALAYRGLSAMLEAKKQVTAESERLTRLQTAFSVIERDLEQAVARSIRDEFGERQPAMVSLSGLDQVLELTRNGWNNPTGRLRSSEQRVAYRLEEDRLLRAAWADLDRLPDSKPAIQAVLTGVELLKIEFLNDQDKWLDHWPPRSLVEMKQKGFDEQLPRAIGMSLEIAGLGKINRIFLVTGRGRANEGTTPAQ